MTNTENYSHDNLMNLFKISVNEIIQVRFENF